MIRKGSFLILAFISVLFLVSNASAWELRVVWNPNAESDLAGYNLYIGTTYKSVENMEEDEEDLDKFSTENTYFCYEIPDYVDCVFLGLTAFDHSGNESEMVPRNIVYYLKGNIVGTAGDGTPYTQARVDIQDLSFFGANYLLFGTEVDKQYPDCDSYFESEPATISQILDINKDGWIDVVDYSILSLNFGKTANMP